MATPSGFVSDPTRRSLRCQKKGAAIKTDAKSTAHDMQSVQELRLLFPGICLTGMDCWAVSMQPLSIAIPDVVISDMTLALGGTAKAGAAALKNIPSAAIIAAARNTRGRAIMTSL